MDIDRIRYFNVFAETGSLVRAAEVLHISQPALSKALKLLEHEVGSKLLEPDGRGLKLTLAGQILWKETSPMLNQWLGLPRRLKDQATWHPTKLGSFEVFTTYFLGYLVKYVGLEEVEVHEYGPGRLEEAVVQEKVDIGITYVPVPKSGIEFIEVTKIKMGVFGIKDSLNENQFPELPFVIPLLPADGTPSKVIGLDGWPDHKFERKIKYRVTLMESALELCRSGRCVAYFPEFVVHLHNEQVRPSKQLVEFKAPISQKDRLQSVFLVQRKGSQDSQLSRQIAKCLRSLK